MHQQQYDVLGHESKTIVQDVLQLDGEVDHAGPALMTSRVIVPV